MPSTGLEPATPSLGGTCSNPTELREHNLNYAEKRIRTPVSTKLTRLERVPFDHSGIPAIESSRINPIKSFINTNFQVILKTTIITWKRPLPFRIGKLSRLCYGNSFRREVKFISCLSLSYRIYDSYDLRKSQGDFLNIQKMIIPIRCFSCGKPIAQLWEEFKKRTNEGEDSKEAMDDLGLERYCCRSIFLGQVDTLELINKFKKF